MSILSCMSLMENWQYHQWTSQILGFNWRHFRGKTKKRKEMGRWMQNYDSSSSTLEKKDTPFSKKPLAGAQGNLAEHFKNKIKTSVKDDENTSKPTSGSLKCYGLENFITGTSGLNATLWTVSLSPYTKCKYSLWESHATKRHICILEHHGSSSTMDDTKVTTTLQLCEL